MPKADREFDVIVWGATGFTGRLVAGYLQRHFGGQLRFAIAARNPDKLAQVAAEIGAQDVPRVIADSHDSESLHAMAARTRVICTTVGPYTLYGSQLVAACVANGTDYCDLAGEVPWIRRMIDTHHDAAQASGARIVPCCGFDSIPSDLGVWFIQQQALEQTGAPCVEVKYRVKAVKGTASGGTVASLMQVVEAARADRDVARVVRHPYSFNPPGERKGLDRPDQQGAVYDHDIEAWTAPFVMAAINTKVVRRTNALLDYPYGREFRYSESVITGPGVLGRAKALAIAASMGGLMLGAAFKPTRFMLSKFILPKPGAGPSESQRVNGFFNIALIGRQADGTMLRAKVTADQDPGYGATSGMLAEAAVCLARDIGRQTVGGGVWTPAAAMGSALITRLRARAGMSFDLV